MEAKEISNAVADVLARYLDLGVGNEISIRALGNRVHVFINEDEFVLVVHTTRSERRRPKHKLDEFNIDAKT